MSMEKLREFSAYGKALELFDLVVRDMRQLQNASDTLRLRSQQIASADSICANMDEGAGRWTTKEYCQYLVVSRGSTAETMGRYERMQHWLPADVVEDRVNRCNEILSILSTTITKLRRKSE